MLLTAGVPTNSMTMANATYAIPAIRATLTEVFTITTRGARPNVGGVRLNLHGGGGQWRPAGHGTEVRMHVGSTMRTGRWIGILAVVAALAAIPAGVGARGIGEPAQSETGAHDRAWAEVRALFDRGADGSYLGVNVGDVEDGDRPTGAGEGAVVTEVVDGAPAAAAGIEAGDVIVEFDGERIRGARQLTRVVRETPAGRSVAAIVFRDGARVTVNVTPGERPRPDWRANLRRMEILEPDAAESFLWRGDTALLEGLPDMVNGALMSLAGRARLGIRGESVDGQLAEFFGVSAGVLVRHVEEETVAAAAGLRAGDVITAIDGEAVDDVRALRRSLSAFDSGASFDIAIVRDGAEMSLAAELEESSERRPRGRRRGTGI